MTVTVKKGIAAGSLMAPPSKSHAHRALICGALGGGSTVENLDFSQDIRKTLSALSALGATVQTDGNRVQIGGLKPDGIKPRTVIDCGESGSTLRFLIPLCLASGQPIALTGSKRLFCRPLHAYEEICREQGLFWRKTDDRAVVQGPLQSGKYALCGNLSSQFVSGLLFALPFLPADSVIDISDLTESISYVNLTLKTLADFGVRITRADEKTLYVKGNQRVQPRRITVEGDYSNAAFFGALNCFGGNVMIEGLDPESVQGDRVFPELFQKLERKNARIDLSDCPDLAPILMAVAAGKNGAVFTGTGRLRLKESDRVESMRLELAKFGVRVEEQADSVTVMPQNFGAPMAVLDGHNDHRIVMALSILCTLTGGKIRGAEAVAKSLPDFFERLAALGISCRKTNGEKYERFTEVK